MCISGQTPKLLFEHTYDTILSICESTLLIYLSPMSLNVESLLNAEIINNESSIKQNLIMHLKG